MDPNKALQILRDWASTALLEDRSKTETDAAQFFEVLDNWLSKGGFLPEDWSVQHDEYPRY